MRETLERVRPSTIGQASRIPGRDAGRPEPGACVDPGAGAGRVQGREGELLASSKLLGLDHVSFADVEWGYAPFVALFTALFSLSQ